MNYARLTRHFAAALLAGGLALGANAAHIEQNTIVLDHAFTFAADTAELTPESAAAVQELAEFLRAKTALTRVRIEGHVAGTGADGAAQKLSEQRALAVVRQLIALQVECARLLPVGFGDTKPIAAPRTAAGNTRIEIHPAALRGRLIGGLPEAGGGRVAGDPCAR